MKNGTDAVGHGLPLMGPPVEAVAAVGQYSVVLAGRAASGFDEVALDVPLLLQAGEEGVDRAFADEFEASVFELAGHLVAIAGVLGDQCEQAHVEHAFEEL